MCVRGHVNVCQGSYICVLEVMYLCVRGHVFVCQRSCICVLGVMYLCVRGHVFVCQESCICVLEVMYLCVRGTDCSPFSTICRLDFGTFLTEWKLLCLSFYLLHNIDPPLYGILCNTESVYAKIDRSSNYRWR